MIQRKNAKTQKRKKMETKLSCKILGTVVGVHENARVVNGL